MITIIDYGIGNIRSVEKAFEAVSAEVLRTDRREHIEKASKLVLPGVGAFGACAAELRRRGLDQPVISAVERGIPLLGVCVGMQLLFDVSEEMGEHEGLGILAGRVRRLDAKLNPPGPDDQRLKIPHMGWNQITKTRENPLLEGVPDGAYFYFVHSYFTDAKERSDVLASCRYGLDFPAIVHRNMVFGIQFHPEKSQRYGLRILANFATI